MRVARAALSLEEVRTREQHESDALVLHVLQVYAELRIPSARAGATREWLGGRYVREVASASAIQSLSVSIFSITPAGDLYLWDVSASEADAEDPLLVRTRTVRALDPAAGTSDESLAMRSARRSLRSPRGHADAVTHLSWLPQAFAAAGAGAAHVVSMSFCVHSKLRAPYEYSEPQATRGWMSLCSRLACCLQILSASSDGHLLLWAFRRAGCSLTLCAEYVARRRSSHIPVISVVKVTGYK